MLAYPVRHLCPVCDAVTFDTLFQHLTQCDKIIPSPLQCGDQIVKPVVELVGTSGIHTEVCQQDKTV